MEIAGQHQVLVLVAGEAASLEVDNEGMRHEEVGPEDGLLHVRDFKVPDEALPGKLQGNHPGAIAVDPCSASTDQVVLGGGEVAGGEAERLPVERRDCGKTLVKAPMSTNIGMSKSSSVSHSRQAGALSTAQSRFLAWNGAGDEVEAGASVLRPELDWSSWRRQSLAARGRRQVPGAPPSTRFPNRSRVCGKTLPPCPTSGGTSKPPASP